MKRLSCTLLVCCVFLALADASALALAAAGKENGAGAAAPALGPGVSVTLRAPLFSPLFAETPVASVDGSPLVLGEVAARLADRQAGVASGQDAAALGDRFSRLLDELIAERGSVAGDQVTERDRNDPHAVVYADRRIAADGTVRLRVPLFSPLFAQTPVAAVNEEPIVLAELGSDL
ncbi:MAG: hypothetical protein IH608_07660, partial [Proteobacteria bacterium]|nr:hypothetical protein [Pseudomonadota bacterium]